MNERVEEHVLICQRALEARALKRKLEAKEKELEAAHEKLRTLQSQLLLDDHKLAGNSRR